ncbi:hypothetical protein D3C78_1699710 [compost metagenome]
MALPMPTRLLMGPRKLPAMPWKATSMPMLRCPSVMRKPPTIRMAAVVSPESKVGSTLSTMVCWAVCWVADSTLAS